MCARALLRLFSFSLLQLLAFIDQKSRALYTQKIKAQRLTWTQSWRRKNKKGKAGRHAHMRAAPSAHLLPSPLLLSDGAR